MVNKKIRLLARNTGLYFYIATQSSKKFMDE